MRIVKLQNPQKTNFLAILIYGKKNVGAQLHIIQSSVQLLCTIIDGQQKQQHSITKIFLVGFNYPLFCIPWLKAVLTGTNYDGTLCIIKKYKSTSEECHHWISIHFPSISHLSRKWPLKFLMEVIIIRPVFMLLPLPYWNIFGTIFVFISHKSHKCLADFSQSFIIGMAAKLAHKNVAKNTKRTTSC